MIVIQNESLLNLLKIKYTLPNIHRLIDHLKSQELFHFPISENGLFSAAIAKGEREYIGYKNVWVRDNIYVAYSHYINGEINVAFNNLKTLMSYFKKHRNRFTGIIEGKVNPANSMERPHIRFDGQTLEEIDQQWNHAQNDALGYFLWFYCKLANEKLLPIQSEDLEILALFPFYFQAVCYWEDEDSGHWEEERKIEASSIGTVIAGLREMKQLLTDTLLASQCQYNNKFVTVELLDKLINQGTSALNQILPFECIQSPPQERRYDAALLFLIYPLQVIEGEMADCILNNVINNLQGDYGIRRYLGDSFWCRNYKDIPEEIRTTISIEREQWFKEQGQELQIEQEAQWCIFDPTVSAIFGLKFQKSQQAKHLEQQTHYLNRSLGQLTGKGCELGEFKCPELYYLQDGHYIPNDATPLLWTQANLWTALKIMEESLQYLQY